MNIFLKRLFLFLLPIGFFLGLPMLYFLLTGENFVSQSRFKEIIKSEKYLIGYLYNESNYKTLKQIALDNQPKIKVMALGSSRVTQFRSFMFQSSFFNAGYTISTINQFKDYLKSIPESKYPEVLLIGLDQWMFNENWDKVEYDSSVHLFENAPLKINFLPTSQQYLNFWNDLVFHRSAHFKLFTSQSSSEIKFLGLNAHFYGMGFRPDGSFNYGTRIRGLLQNDPSVKDYGFEDTFERIKSGVFRFEYGEEVNPKAILALEELFSYCKLKKIKVVAFLTPFAPSVAIQLKNSPNHQYIAELPILLSSLHKRGEAEILDFTDIERLESSDQEFLDGFHSGEVANVRMLLEMARNNSALADHLDTVLLKKYIERRTNPLEIHPSISKK